MREQLHPSRSSLGTGSGGHREGACAAGPSRVEGNPTLDSERRVNSSGRMPDRGGSQYGAGTVQVDLQDRLS